MSAAVIPIIVSGLIGVALWRRAVVSMARDAADHPPIGRARKPDTPKPTPPPDKSRRKRK